MWVNQNPWYRPQLSVVETCMTFNYELTMNYELTKLLVSLRVRICSIVIVNMMMNYECVKLLTFMLECINIDCDGVTIVHNDQLQMMIIKNEIVWRLLCFFVFKCFIIATNAMNAVHDMRSFDFLYIKTMLNC